MVVCVGFFLGLGAIAEDGRADRAGRMFAEMEGLFPETLDAVIVSAGDVEMQLRDESMLPGWADQRVLIEVAGREGLVEILTYSGRVVRVETESGVRSFTPLISGSGEILVLVDNNLVATGAGWIVEARRI